MHTQIEKESGPSSTSEETIRLDTEQPIEIAVQRLNNLIAQSVHLLVGTGFVSLEAWLKALLCPDGMIHDAASRLRCTSIQETCYQPTSPDNPCPCPAKEKDRQGCDCDTTACISGLTDVTIVTATLQADSKVWATVSDTTTATEAAPNQAPVTPHTPVPADGAGDVPINQTLAWQGDDPDGDPVTYTLAINAAGQPPVVDTTTLTSYTPSLITGTVYSWVITATDGMSESAGAIWSFTRVSGNEYKIYLPLVLRAQ